MTLSSHFKQYESSKDTLIRAILMLLLLLVIFENLRSGFHLFVCLYDVGGCNWIQFIIMS